MNEDGMNEEGMNCSFIWDEATRSRFRSNESNGQRICMHGQATQGYHQVSGASEMILVRSNWMVIVFVLILAMVILALTWLSSNCLDSSNASEAGNEVEVLLQGDRLGWLLALFSAFGILVSEYNFDDACVVL
jgi:hypothetical protein